MAETSRTTSGQSDNTQSFCTLCHGVVRGGGLCPLDGKAAETRAFLPVPESLRARFTKPELLAAGASGTLYRVWDNGTSRDGVLKIMSAGPALAATERQRVRRELSRQTTLRHEVLGLPIAVGEVAQEAGSSSDVNWLFRDFVDGISLASALAKRGPFEASEAISIVRQVAAGLDELHRAGLLHRDVKPGHVLLRDVAGPTRVTLIDSGVAARLGSVSNLEVLGTLPYISPEQAAGKLVSFRSDLFSLGCLFYELLTGRAAFAPDSIEGLLALHTRGIGSSLEITANIPEPVVALLKQMLAVESRERPFSAQQVRKLLEPYDDSKIEITRIERLSQVSGTPTAAKSEPISLDSLTASLSSKESSLDYDDLEETSAKDADPLALAELGYLVGGQIAPLSPPAPPSGTFKATVIGLPAVSASKPLSVPPPPPPRNSTVLGMPAAKPVELLDADIEIDDMTAPSVVAPTAVSSVNVPVTAAHAQVSVPAPELPAALLAAAESAVVPSAAQNVFAPPASLLSAQITPPAPSVHEAQGNANAWAGDGPTAQYSGLSDAEAAQYASAGYSAPTAQGYASALPSESLPPVARSVAPAKKKSVLPIVLGVAAMGLFGLTAVGVGGYYYLSKKASEAQAILDAELQRQLAAPVSVSVAPTPQAAPVPGGGAPAPAPVAAPVGVAAPAPEPIVIVAPGTPAAAPAPEATPVVAAAPVAAAPVAAAPEPAARQSSSSTSAREPARTRQAAARPTPAAVAAEAPRAPAAGTPSSTAASPFDQVREEARQHFSARRFPQAATAYERAAALNPSHAGSFAGLGAAKLAMGDTSGAVRAYERAVQLAPSNSGFFAALGRAYLTAGRNDRASAAYQRALSLDPNNRAAREGLARAQ